MFWFKRSSSVKTNEISLHQINILVIFLRQFKNPLLIILVIAAVVSFFLGERVDSIVILSIITVSILLGFWNEFQAEKTVADLLRRVSLNAIIIKNGQKEEIPARDLQVGDEVLLTPGAMVPADLKLLASERLEIDESVLSGESVPVDKGEKNSDAYLGTVVTSGTGTGKVIAIGQNTKFGKISLDLALTKPQTEFQKGLAKFGLLIVRVISIMTVVIFAGNFLLGHAPIESLLFALSIAIGLTPELMPVVVTVSMSHGARRMAKKEVIVKRLVAIEDLGNMEVLCTDKTGTLTEGKLAVHDFFDIKGQKNELIITQALLCNGAIVHHKIFGDAIDSALWRYQQENNLPLPKGRKVVEEPFNFTHRLMYVVVKDEKTTTLIAKGAPEEIIHRSKLLPGQRRKLEEQFHKLSNDGLRVIAVGVRNISPKEKYDFGDVDQLDFTGFITFLDKPKPTVREALQKLASLNVQLKIVTGDNELVTKKICSEVGLEVKNLLLGKDLDKLSEDELASRVWDIQVFARMSPEQKMRIIKALQKGDHSVGYLGDGINDGPALHLADAGISVNSAVDVAKDAAAIVLLKKSLMVIADGVVEGRKIFNNTIKYILMGTSSNFGNMFSAAGASFLLPFLPMTPGQILLTNGLYDISQLAIPGDNVDSEMLARPRRWDTNLIKKYMIAFGPLSSIYDYITYGLMLFVFHAKDSLFQTGWFVESLITEIMVVFVIRTNRPFFKSRPSWSLLIICLSVIAAGTALPFLPFGRIFGFTPLPALFFLVVIVITITYLALVEIAKHLIVKSLFKNEAAGSSASP